MKIIVVGSSGLVGSLLLPRLEAHELVLIGRRPNRSAPARARQLTGATTDWPALMTDVRAEIAICALGSTMAQAGSQAAFAAVDRDAVISFAQAAHRCGARQFLLVSSVGANPRARNFYLATKGEAESGVSAAGFDRVDIFRPGLLRGVRGGDRRLGEQIAIALSPLTNLLTPAMFDQYRAIDADDVAAAIAAMVGADESGCFIHHNCEMRARLGTTQ